MGVRSYFDGFQRRDWQVTDDIEPVRFAVVGLGWWSETHALSAIDRSDFCDSTVLVSGSEEKAIRLASEYGAGRTLSYREYHDGVAADEYDAVYVVTPNALHLEYVETAAALGKDVVCEKPLEATAERAERLVSACEDADVTLMTAYRMQADPVMRRGRELIADGVIGDPVQIHGGFSYPLVGALPGQWRREEELSGGGALMDIGIYPLNTTRFLLDADPTGVQATASSPDPEFENVSDEHVAFQLTFPDAVTASFTASFGEFSDNRLQVIGTEGQLLVEPAFDTGVDRTVILEWPGQRMEYTAESTNEVIEEFDYFAHSLRTGADLRPDGRDGSTDVQIAMAVYESARTGERVLL